MVISFGGEWGGRGAQQAAASAARTSSQPLWAVTVLAGWIGVMTGLTLCVDAFTLGKIH
jgi:hypothetical protein